MKRILAIARKEVYHIVRDRRSLVVAVAMPIIMVLIYGSAIDMELKNIAVGILDDDRTDASRDLIDRLTAGGFILDAGRLASRREIEPGFRQGRFRAVVVIPGGYAESLLRSPFTRIQTMIDGADGSTAAAVDNYLMAVIETVNRDLAEERLGAAPLPIEARTRIYFNPELVSAHFIVPGLVAVILIMICVLLTSIAITREKETGTMEQVLATPVTPSQVVIGKVIPYVVIGSVDAALALALGRLVFAVPMCGSWWVLAGYSLLYLIIALALGLLISAVSGTQRVAMLGAQVATFMPTVVLSGFVFAHSSMPPALRALSKIVPATYYLRIIRGIMLKGQAWFPLEFGVMLFMAVFFMGMAIARLRVTLE